MSSFTRVDELMSRGNWEVAVTASWNSIDGRRETAGVHYGNSAVVEVKQEEVVKVKQEERGISNMNAPLSKETPRMQASAAGGSSAVATSTARATAASTASTARATAASAASTATATAASATNTARGASAKRVVRDNSVDGVMPSPSKRAAIAKSVADSLVDAMTARANASINVGTESDVEIKTLKGEIKKLQRYKAENEGLRRVVAVKNTELIVLRERDETGFTWKQEHRAERAEAKLKVSVAGAALTNASCASLQAVVVKLKGDNELANASRASLQAEVAKMKRDNELTNASRASLHAVVFKLKGDNELANASRASLQAEVAKMKNNAEMMIHWIKERDMALHRHGEIALYRSQHITHLQNCLVAAWQTSQTTPH
jgi:hypothetical protein